MRPRKISVRDPLWGYVDLSEQETAVVDSSAFQRLRGIKQLSFADLVYPSATHTRFAHSIGALHVSDVISRQIGLSDGDRQVVRLSLLLHDLGHGPYSHLFEDIHREVSGRAEPLDHEVVTRAVVRLDTSIKAALGPAQGQVLATISGERGILSEIVSGGLDADRFDYLLRDSYHAGVVYGQYDFPRIRHTLIQHQGHVAIRGKGADAVEGLRLAREQMSFQVYYHHTKIVAEKMLVRGVALAVADGLLPRSAVDIDQSNPASWEGSFWVSDDHRFTAALQECCAGRSKEILDALRQRRLLKRAYLAEPEDIEPVARGEVQGENFDPHAMETAVARGAGIQDHWVIVAKPVVSTKQYRSVAAREPILILPEGRTELVEYEKFARLQGPSTDPWRLIVYSPEDSVDAIRGECKKYLASLR